MVGLDDSEKNNLLEKNNVVLCLGTLSVCPLTSRYVISFPNEWMTNEEHDDNIYILQHRSFGLGDDWKQMAIIA